MPAKPRLAMLIDLLGMTVGEFQNLIDSDALTVWFVLSVGLFGVGVRERGRRGEGGRGRGTRGNTENGVCGIRLPRIGI